MKRRDRFLVGDMLSALILCSTACSAEEGPATLSRIEAEIFDQSCALSFSCHSGPTPGAGLNLVAPTHSKIVEVASTEKPEANLVVPGNPDESFLLDKLLNRNLPEAPEGETPWTSMPPGVRLESRHIDLVRRWIEAGANDD